MAARIRNVKATVQGSLFTSGAQIGHAAERPLPRKEVEEEAPSVVQHDSISM